MVERFQARGQEREMKGQIGVYGGKKKGMKGEVVCDRRDLFVARARR